MASMTTVEKYRQKKWGCGFLLEAIFKLKENKTDVRTEVIAGITTFMTMAYIIFVNPDILKNAGIPFSAAMATTALVAGIASIFMGLYTNYPFALASGMGLNAALTFSVVLGMKQTWQVAMGVVFVEGLIVTLLVLTNVREAVMNAIPLSLKKAIGGGIGLFIAFIGLKNAGIVVADPATFVKVGNFTSASTVVAAAGIIITALLISRKVKGSILIGIIVTTIISLFTGITKLPAGSWVNFSIDLSTVGKLDILGALKLGMITTIFAFLISDFFDTMGSVIAIGTEAGHVGPDGKLPRLKNVLFADSIAAVIGGFFGASSATTYVESASGVAEGGRTGLTAVVVGILFLAALPFAPIVGIVPSVATAPALIIVGFLMMTVVKDIPFAKFDEGFPSFLTLIGIPLTYSIADGIGLGFVSFALIKLLSGKNKELHPLMYVVTILFIINFLKPIMEKVL